MEIGRLEFYATKRDVRGKYFGKIHPYSQTLRNSVGGGLVFFHESCIPSASALRTDRRLQGYRYKTRSRGSTVYAEPVYVAFDMPRGSSAHKGDVASTVMLLGEADPDELPELSSVEGPGVRVALITAFPSVYTLSRIGVDLVESDHVAQFKACWDGSDDDEKLGFVRSLDSVVLGKALTHLVGIDKMESPSLASPRRTRLALSARPGAALIPEVAAKLTPSMWVDEFLAIMGEPDERNTLMSSAQPPFQAYALAKFAEGGGSLEDDLAVRFVAAVRGSAGAGIATECLGTVLTAQPRLALRDEMSEMLTPELWVDGLLDLMRDPAERSALLGHAQPAFIAEALVRLAESGALLDGEATRAFATAIRGCVDRTYATSILRRVLSAQPRLALSGDVAEFLTPDVWVDGLMGLMERPEDRHALLAAARPEFHAYAVSRFVEAGGVLDDGDAKGFVAAIRACGESKLAPECLAIVLDRQPRISLVDGVATILTPETWVDGLLDLMGNQADVRTLLAHARPAFRTYATARYVEAGARLAEADVQDFVAAARKCGDADLATECLAAVLANQPQIALVGSVASLLTPEMWVDGFLGLMGTPQGQMALLAPSQPAFRAHAVQKLIEAGIDLDIGVLGLCPLRSCPALLHQVQWSVDDASYADAVGRWLREARLCDGEGRRLVVSAAEHMHSTGDLLSPTMWVHLPAVMGIRLCVFWSNHYKDLDAYAVRGGVTKLCLDAKENSWRGYDPALKAALLLLSLPLWANRNDWKQVFLDANDALVCEVVRQFNDCEAGSLQSFELGDGLQSLLQRCVAYSYAHRLSVRGFCDGRWWERGNSVWCHAGADRPGGGRRKCDSLRTSVNATDGSRGVCPDPEDQFMADLLTNADDAMGGGVNVGPWLACSAMDLVEYTYRVSGYVNKLASALPHMVCRTCGSRLRQNYEYPRKNLYRELDAPALSVSMCRCPNAGDGRAHEDVYIHYCNNCHRVIDSRECRMRDVNADGSPGMYLCMYCGASGVYRAATACPSCGNTDLSKLRYYRGSMRDEMPSIPGRPPSGEILIACKARGCMYDAREFRSEFE